MFSALCICRDRDPLKQRLGNALSLPDLRLTLGFMILTGRHSAFAPMSCFPNAGVPDGAGMRQPGSMSYESFISPNPNRSVINRDGNGILTLA